LSVDYNKAKEEYVQRYGNLNEADAVHSLIKMDAGKYANMLTDLVMGESCNWANLDFLERDKEKDGPDGLKNEITCLTQEKADLAGELEKHQTMLRLQSDIQRENDEFYKREIERLQLVERSAHAKLEELARRVDEKQKTIFETEKKLTHDEQFMPTAMKTHKAGIDSNDLMEVQSEFSAVTNETEI